MPYEHYGELTSFGLSLDLAFAGGMFDGSLTVRDGCGAYPVVAALAEERLRCVCSIEVRPMRRNHSVRKSGRN